MTRPSTRSPQDQVWLRTLRSCRDGEHADGQSVTDLYALLLRMARAQAYRAGPRWGLWGPELDEVAHDAAGDAMLALASRVETFRGDARFTTWAFPFVRLAVLSSLRRGQWSTTSDVSTVDDSAAVQVVPCVAGLPDPAGEAETAELLDAVRHLVRHALSTRQRHVLVALVFHHVSPQELAERMQMSRNSVYKCAFDARRKLRTELERQGLVTAGSAATSRRPRVASPRSA